MSRSFRDADFEEWEVVSTVNRTGSDHPSRLVFRSRSQPLRRPRVVELPDDPRTASARLKQANREELVDFLGRSAELA